MVNNRIDKIFTAINNNKGYYFGFLVAFTISKIALVGVPILLSNQVNPNLYSNFEYGLSWGLILSVLFRLGFEYSFTNYNLVKKDESYNSVVYFHGLLLGAIAIIVFILYFLNFFSERALISISFGLVLASQGLISNTYFTQGKPASGSINQNGLLNVVGIVCIILLLTKKYNFNDLLLISLGLYFLYIEFVTYKYFRESSKISILKGYKTVLDFGLRSLVFVLIYMWIFHSWKILTERFLGIAMVGIFSIYYRVTSVTIVFEKLIEQLFFKQIYQKPLKIIDKYYSVFLSLILVIGLLIAFVFKTFFLDYVILIKDSISLYPSLLWVFTISMVFWSSITLSQRVILREKISGRVIFLYISISVVSYLGLCLLNINSSLNIENIVLFYSLILYVLSEINFYEIYKKQGYRFNYSRIVSFFSLLILIAFYTVNKWV